MCELRPCELYNKNATEQITITFGIPDCGLCPLNHLLVWILYLSQYLCYLCHWSSCAGFPGQSECCYNSLVSPSAAVKMMKIDAFKSCILIWWTQLFIYYTSASTMTVVDICVLPDNISKLADFLSLDSPVMQTNCLMYKGICKY